MSTTEEAPCRRRQGPRVLSTATGVDPRGGGTPAQTHASCVGWSIGFIYGSSHTTVWEVRK